MKLSHQLTATRTLCCVILSAVFVFNAAVADAQFPSLKGIRIPKVRTSSSSRVTEYLPQAIQAAETLQRVRQQRQHYQPVPKPPVHKINHPPKVCPQPAPPKAGQPPVAPPAASPNVPETKVSLARSLVPRAKQAFAAEDYDRAISILDQILKLVPEDADAYQFRSLAYFAKGEFEPSAADAYDSFRFGNAWTWDTLQSMYPEGKTSRYTEQLRKLEEVNRSDDQSMPSHFLLAYQYIVLGHLSHAETELKAVLAINQEEQLSQQLLAVVQNAQNQEQFSQK